MSDIGVELSALPAAAPLDGTETFPLVQGGVTKRTTGLAPASHLTDAAAHTGTLALSVDLTTEQRLRAAYDRHQHEASELTLRPDALTGLVMWLEAKRINGFTEPTTYASDAFGRADSTTALGVPDLGETWTNLISAFGIISGQAYAPSTVPAVAVTELPGADASVSAAITLAAGSVAGFVLRAVDANNYLHATFDTGSAKLFKVVGGVQTQLALTLGSSTAGSTYTATARIRGNTFEMLVNGLWVKAALSGADITTFAGARKVGLYAGGTGHRFDTFTAKAPHIVDGMSVDAWANLAADQPLATAKGPDDPLQRAFYRDNAGSPYVENTVSGAVINLAMPSLETGESTVLVVARSSGAGVERVVWLGPSGTKSLSSFQNRLAASASAPLYSGIAMSSTADGVYGFAGSAAGFGGGLGAGAKLVGNGEATFRTQDAGSSTWSAAAVTTGALMGRGPGQGSERFTGRLSAVLIFNRALSDAELSAMVGYLARAHGIAPLALPPEQLVFDGDSMTSGQTGTGFTNAYPDKLLLDLAARAKSFVPSITGQTVLQMTADAATQVDPLYNPNRTHNVVVCWGGTNDLTASTAAVTYDRIVAYCQARRTAGFKVVVGTILPRAPSGTIEPKRTELNALIRANWATFADALADMGNDPTIGQAGQETNLTYYQGDQIHLTGAGYDIVAGIVRTALGTLGVA